MGEGGGLTSADFTTRATRRAKGTTAKLVIIRPYFFVASKKKTAAAAVPAMATAATATAVAVAVASAMAMLSWVSGCAPWLLHGPLSDHKETKERSSLLPRGRQ